MNRERTRPSKLPVVVRTTLRELSSSQLTEVQGGRRKESPPGPPSFTQGEC